jgi:CheY-like chemotaxis protein
MGDTSPSLAPHGSRSVRVLIAENDPVAGAFSARTLQNAGYAVELVTRGDQALERLREQPFDLLVADVVMPELDGFALVRAMRRDERLTRVPVVLLTCYEAYAMRLRAFRAGCDSYLIKPVKAEELVDEVASMLMGALGTSAQLNAASLSGRLDGGSLAAILGFLHVQEQSGMLRIARFGASGEIAIDKGEPRCAYLGDEITGEPALVAMLGWNAGAFRFEPSDTSAKRTNLRGPFAALLERAQRCRDQL